VVKDASLLSERFAFERPANVPNGGGGTMSGWETQHECWAQVTYLRGTEPVIASRLVGVQPVVIRVRNCEAARQIGSDWQARDMRTETVYALTGNAVPSDNRAYLDFMAKSGVTP
jgi:head-tail adaptor